MHNLPGLMDRIAIKKKILDFTINGVEKLLQENPDLEFYAFAYDCMAFYGVINLCFNTEEEFQKSLIYYKGKYPTHYDADKDVLRLKYNTADWVFPMFETLDFFSREELTTFQDEENVDELIETLLETFCECLIEFTATATYKKIPKTADFIVFCVDHDETFEDAQKRFEKVKARYN